MNDEPSHLGWDPQRLSEALRVAGLGEFEWDLANDIIRVSAFGAEITGFEHGVGLADGGGAFASFVHPDDLAATQAAAKAQLRAGQHFMVEGRFIRPNDGRVVWVRMTGQQVRNDAGQPVAVVGVLQDVTARKDEEDRRVTLMAELDHRVKNVLATVQALAAQTAKRTTSLDNFLQTFSGRLKAMASANELLTAARWRGASVEHLASAELGALAPGQTRWGGPELFLTPRAANALSLALHELATNALKFGALSTETGRVNLRWSRLAAGGFELLWTESDGPPVSPPAHHGFGSTLLEQVTGRELNGETTVEYRAGGVLARLRAGAAALVERPETVPEAPRQRVVETVTASGGPAELNGARVLIVEDAVLLALELETGLSEAGAQVVGPAYELEEAMGLLDQPIDAAVLDANLNGRSVTPVAQVLADRGVPFLFATGYGEAGGPPTGFDAPIIRKPYDVTQVAAAVAALLAAH